MCTPAGGNEATDAVRWVVHGTASAKETSVSCILSDRCETSFILNSTDVRGIRGKQRALVVRLSD